MPKSTRRIFPVAAGLGILVAGGGLYAIANYVNGEGSQIIPKVNQTAPPKPSQRGNRRPNAEPRGEKISIAVRDGDSIRLVSRQIVRTGDDRTDVLSASFKNTGFDAIRVTGTDLSPNGVLFIDLNSAVQDGMSSTEEGDFVRIIQTALSQFGDVKYFQLRVDGQVLDTLGHLELSEPIPVNGVKVNGETPPNQP